MPAGIPSAWELKSKLLRLICPRFINPNVLDEEIRRSAGNSNLDTATLEEVTQVACKYDSVRKVAIQFLREICLLPGHGEVPPPVLQYEVLAHLVRQGFVDHVISFNFDELFDEAILNELGAAHARIVSERDYLVLDELPKHTSYLIKPHGTISSPLSLRFTRSDVETFPEALAEFIKDRILPPLNCRTVSGEVVGATVIVVGFSMRDPAFNSIVEASQIQRLYRIDTVGPSNANATRTGPLPAPVPEVPLVDTSGVMLLSEIWDRIDHVAGSRGYRPPSMARHHALSLLFRKGAKSGMPIPAEARARADIVLAAARSKGQVAMDALAMNPRISRYSRTASDLIDLASRSLLRGASQSRGLEGRTHLVRDANVLVSNLLEIQQSFRKRDRSDEAALRRHVEDLIAGDEVAVARAEDPVNRFQFRSAEPIHTAMELRERTLGIIQDPRVTRVLTISESGFWLSQPWVKQAMSSRDRQGSQPLTCEVITIRPDEMPPLSRVFTDLREYCIPLAASDTAPLGHLAIHWWEHNRHLTLGLAGQDASSSEAVAGIYFLRRQNNPLIHPVYVTDPFDTAILQSVFWRYRMKHFRRRAYVAALRDTQGMEALHILECSIGHEGPEVQAHFAAALKEMPRLTQLDSDSGVLGAYIGGVDLDTDILVGILAFTDEGFERSPSLKRTVKIEVVAVDPVWRRCGIGRLLIEAFEDRVSQHGGRTTVLTPGSSGDLPGRDEFLTRMGYYEREAGHFEKRMEPYFLSR